MTKTTLRLQKQCNFMKQTFKGVFRFMENQNQNIEGLHHAFNLHGLCYMI